MLDTLRLRQLQAVRTKLKACAIVLLLSSMTAGCGPELNARPVTPNANATRSSTTACVTIQTTLADDPHIEPTSALLSFKFENRCEEAVLIDWKNVVVMGFITNDDADLAENDATGDGNHEDAQKQPPNAASSSPSSSPVMLVMFDPHRHVKLGRLDGMRGGSEAFRFDVPGGAASSPPTRSSGAPSSHEQEEHGHDVHGQAKKKQKRKVDDTRRLTRVCVDLSRVVEDEDAGEKDGNNRDPSLKNQCIDMPGDASVVDMTKSGFREAHDDHYADFYPSYGTEWNTDGFPRFRLDTGVSMHSTSLRGVPLSSTKDNIEIDGARIGDRVSAWTLDLRGTSFIHGPLYTGLELGGGLGGTRGVVLRPDERDRVTVSRSDPSGHLMAAAVFGVSGRIGMIQPHVEIGLGARYLIFTLDANSPCASSSGCVHQLDHAWWTVSPRGGVDVWVHPNITLGAYVGVDALHSENVSGGLSIGAHMRSFDGR